MILNSLLCTLLKTITAEITSIAAADIVHEFLSMMIAGTTEAAAQTRSATTPKDEL
jgi:hypothetical protein